jgi:surface antigen
MIASIKIGALALIAAAVLSGCGQTKNQDAGVILGSAIGGVLGSTIGGGDGRVVATIAGALAGAYIGNNVGRSMDELDQLKAGRALETAPTGETVAWANPDSGQRYAVTPTRTYHADGGRPCREFTTDAWIDGKKDTVVGTACRDELGVWQTQ